VFRHPAGECFAGTLDLGFSSFRFAEFRLCDGWEQAPVDVHGLVFGCRGVGDMGDETSEGGFSWGYEGLESLGKACGVDSREDAGGGAFHITLHSRDLSCEEDGGFGLGEPEVGEEDSRSIQVSVSVDDSIANELGVLEPWHHLEHTFLFRPLEAGLASDHRVEGFLAVFGSELEHCKGALACAWVLEPDRFEGAEAKGIRSSFGYDFYGEAGFKVRDVFFKIVDGGSFGRSQGFHESVIFFPGERAIEVSRVAFVVSALFPYDSEVNAFRG
jgi:hypothetical protein